jgi:sugar phosphate isomerase/epimerase
MRARYPGAVILLLVMSICTMCDKKELNNIFYVQNTLDGFDNAPMTPGGKAKLLKGIGYDGLEGFGYKDFYELRNALKNEGLAMPVNYVALNFEAERDQEDSSATQIKEMIRSSDKGSVIYFHLHSNTYKNDKVAGDKVITEILRELSDFAQPYGVKLCVYPHISFYCETVAHSVKLARMVDRKNYGASLNLCHLLKVEGPEGIGAKIEEYMPYLFAVNICGADSGDTKNLGWERLIQPLGKGSFNTYHFIKSLRDNGYTGPIGLQCYNLKGDAFETLTSSMDTWKEYEERYRKEQ